MTTSSIGTTVKERPILFNGAMVRAVLDGRKTQTRRVCKVQPSKPADNTATWLCVASTDRSRKGSFTWGSRDTPGGARRWSDDQPFSCPYGQPGDLLWVRESYYAWWKDSKPDRVMGYRADIPPDMLDDGFGCDDPWWLGAKCIPSIHMPRWASRITLEVVDVRVERVQETSVDDAIAEGIVRMSDAHNLWRHYQNENFNGGNGCDPLTSFKSLWNSINAKRGYGWEANPWVWVVEFRMIDAPEVSRE